MESLFLNSVNDVLLEHESREEFFELLSTYTTRLQPANCVESHLVDGMVIARWRHRRYWQIEGELLDSAMELQVGSESRKTAAPTNAFKLAAQLQNSCRRSHERSLETLLNLRESGALSRTGP